MDRKFNSLNTRLGYLYTASKNGTLNYRGIVSMQSQASSINNETEMSYIDKAATIGWKTNPNAFAKFMYMTAVFATNDLDTDKEYMIAAFVGDEVRGVAKSQLINGKYHYFVGIGGNVSNEEIAFKLFDGEKVITLDNIEIFDHTVLLGEVNEPYELKYSSKITEEVALNNVLGLSLRQNIPNPMTDATQISYSIPEDGHVDISLYNVLGQKVYTFVSDTVKGNVLHSINWDGIAENQALSSGIYIYKLNYKGEELQRKLVIE